jgi:hypothetical protein
VVPGLLRSTRWPLAAAWWVGVGCAPPPAVELVESNPAVALISHRSGADVPLTRAGNDLFLDLTLAVDIDGLTFVPPSVGTEDVAGEGHFRFYVNGDLIDEPEERFFSYRSRANQFGPGDGVALTVSLVSNDGRDLDGFEDWVDIVELNVVAPEEPTSELRFVNASPDVGPIDVYASGSDTPLFRDLEFGDASGWLVLPAAPLRIELRAAGASAMSEPLLADILDLVDGARVNGVAGGFVSGPEGGSFRVLPVEEGWGNAVAGRARVRFVHAGPDLPTVTVEGAGGAPPRLTPFSASDEDGETLDVAGGVRLELRADPADAQPLTSFTTPELVEGDGVLLIATGRLGSLAREPEGLRLLAIGAEGPLEPVLQDPQLFVLHGSGDSGSLELCSGTQEVVANFTYGQMGPARLSPGSYDLQIFGYPAGCTGQALNGAGNTNTFEAGERYLVLLTGEQTADASEASIQAASFRDTFTLGDPDNAKVRFVHGASYTQVYVGVVTDGSILEPNVLTPPIAWRVASAEVSVGAGALVLGIADAVGEPPPPYAPIVTFNYAAQGGERQWGIVAGDPTPDNAGDRGLQAIVVDSAPSNWTVALVDVQ